MDEFWRLVLLSLAMFVGCYLAGSIPLALTLSEGVLRKVTTFGAGLLIGTALIVIIPEGVESLFGEVLHAHEAHHTYATASPLSTVASIEPVFPVLRQPQAVENAGNNKDDFASVVLDLTESFTVEQLQLMMGASLVLGFIFMLVIDQVGGGGHSHTHSTDVEVGSGGKHNRTRLTATIGLVVHAAADGLALGAAAGLSKVDVELIIFLAIMLHKAILISSLGSLGRKEALEIWSHVAPAAFGFTSFLIHEGYDRLTAKKHLLAFALAAPVAAFVAYFGLVRVMYVVQLPITGIAMLFSAGTFLYVATVHVLTEVTHSHSSSEPSNAPSNSNLSKFELLMLILGALLPLGFNILHSH